MLTTIALLLLTLGCVISAHPLANECLNIYQSTKLEGVSPSITTTVSSLVDCHRFCRLQEFRSCSTYVYDEISGLCKLYNDYETSESDFVGESFGFVTIELQAECFDEYIRSQRRRRAHEMMQQDAQQTGYVPPATGGTQWTQWTPWGACNVLCGGGNRTRTRTCPTAGQCAGNAAESQACNPQSCCTAWSKWSPCSVTCGEGTQKRTQRCMVEDHTVPSGYASKEQAETQKCTGKMPTCAAWTPWAPWAACSATCGGGQQGRSRTCGPAGSVCAGPPSESQACNPNPCPEWSQWTPWTQCSESCGGGWQIRTRTCSVPDMCPGDPKEKQLCNVQTCPTWGEWQEWGDCTKSCGGGQQTRNRPCMNDDTFCVGANATQPICVCEGAGTLCHEDRPCNEQSCATWTEWCSWTTCSESCGGGWQIRTRNCTVEGACIGDAKEKQLCNVQACPYWGPWNDWLQCDKSCGGGNQNRTRDCVTDDAFCVGDKLRDPSCTCVTATDQAFQTQSCNPQPCDGGGGGGGVNTPGPPGPPGVSPGK